MGLGTYREGSNWACGPWVPRVPQLPDAVFREAQLYQPTRTAMLGSAFRARVVRVSSRT